MSISQFFILSKRGDSIIYRDYRFDIKKCNEIFFRKVNLYSEEEVPPIFNEEGINFIYIKNPDLYFVISSLNNSSPHYFIEILDKIIKIIKDHCGEITEESIKKNFILIYEIIDEIIDFGFPQLSSTEQVKNFIFTEPKINYNNINSIKEMINKNIKSNENTKKSILITNDAKSKNEIYVDIIEKVTCLFNKNGNIVNNEVSGAIKIKSYLKNNPELKIVLSDNIIFGKKNLYNSQRLNINDYNYCKGIKNKDFEKLNTLYIIPPEGEFILMNYYYNNYFNPPFKIFSIVEEFDYKIELKLTIEANFSNKINAGNIIIKFNIPKETQNVYFELPNKNKKNQNADYIKNQQLCIWKIPKMIGGSDYSLDVKIILQINKPNLLRKELGPITMNFEIPNFNISKLQIKELKVLSNDNKYNAFRWVRIFTQAFSYVFRIT